MLRASYHPGFSYDLTSWECTVSEIGLLRQTVKVTRFAPDERRTEHHQITLCPAAVEALYASARQIDFDAIARILDSTVVDDAEECSLALDDDGGHFRAALFSWVHPSTSIQDKSAVATAVHFWTLLESLLPYSRPRK